MSISGDGTGVVSRRGLSAYAPRYRLTDKGYAWVETTSGPLRMWVKCSARTHRKVMSIPHG
jgi:hypothetical protein